ncbi:MAG: heparinase II/III family protein [Planctomycetes bacterium]|nr:heparinase II/III family protein [Planctomycetota bacterium]
MSDRAAPYAPVSIADRGHWAAVARAPHLAPLIDHVEQLCARTEPMPPTLRASDFLAARTGDRGRSDHVWMERVKLGALAFRRCVRGLDPADRDDRLLDWLWAYLSAPTWVAAAHIADHDLPSAAYVKPDLAACEMAATLAELREVMKPWMDSFSSTLADSIITEIDRKVLTPYGDGAYVHWQSPTSVMSNWVGVCAGSILIACESLAAQGFPRPKARARALEGVNIFFEQSFTPHGECDEGVMYWNYGMVNACSAAMRLPRGDFTALVDQRRFAQVASYPQRAHLFDNVFFSGNDSGLRAGAPMSIVPWLAEGVCPWLADWARNAPIFGGTFPHLLRTSMHAPLRSAAPEPARDAAVSMAFLEDQQVAIVRAPTPRGDLTVCLTGGTNDERHNHNDLGHFIVALGDELIVPDLGAPHYRTEFFSDRRYTFLSASSRGHCCPIVGGHEQRAGAEAAGHVVTRRVDADSAEYELELGSAYPVEAGLRSWRRSLTVARHGSDARLSITDRFAGRAEDTIVEVIWSLRPFERIASDTEPTFRLGSIILRLAAPPVDLQLSEVSSKAEMLREYPDQTLHVLSATYRTDSEGRLVAGFGFTFG